MDATGTMNAKEEGQGAFASSTSIHLGGREKAQRRNREFAAWMVGLSFAGDAVVVVSGLLLAFSLRFDTPLRHMGRTALVTMTAEQYRGHFVFLSITLLLILFHFGLYSSGRPPRLRKVNAILVISCGVWFFSNVGLSFVLNAQPIISRIYLGSAFFCTLGALMLWRRGFEAFLGLRPIAAMLQRQILFVGWSEQSQRLLEHIEADSKHPYQIVGCVPSPSGRYDRNPDGRVGALGEYGQLAPLLHDHAIDLVIVADLNPTRGALLDLVNTCEKEMVHLQIIPSCFQVLLSGLHLETTSGVPVLGISRLPLDSPWNQTPQARHRPGRRGGRTGPERPAHRDFRLARLPRIARADFLSTETPWAATASGSHIIKIRSMKLDAEAGRACPAGRAKDRPAPPAHRLADAFTQH